MDQGRPPHLPDRPLLPLAAGEIAALAHDDPRAELLLTRWDELGAPELAALGAHPVLGARLARLRAAERWLGRGLAVRARGEDGRPAAEELYDYAAPAAAGGRATPLPLDRRRAVERHLDTHPDEASWVRGLERRPPSPLLFDAPTGLGALEEDDLVEGPRHAPRRLPRLARWAPLAAAAAVLTTSVLVVRGRTDALDLPIAGIVRGALDEPLQFPRGRVLAAPAGARGVFASEPRFELAAVPGATAYRVELRRHAGGAFEVGELVWADTAAEPELSGPPLVPGRYTWEAFATAGGLERALGALDFQVVEDPLTLERLAHEPLAGQVRSLAADGLATDARHRARLLPDGPERDRFLGRDGVR